jgi:hypothetical protein
MFLEDKLSGVTGNRQAADAILKEALRAQMREK